MLRLRMRGVAALVWLALVAACQLDGTSPDPRPGLNIAGPSSVSDTILKDIIVRVDLRDDQNKPVEKAPVTFKPSGGLWVIGAGPNQNETRLTDTSGRVVFHLVIGCGVGSYSSTITSGAHTRSFHVTISPGQRASVKMVPADTAIYIGASYELDAYMVDQCGNRRPESVRFSGGSAVATIDGSNRVRALSRGRTEFTATAFGETFRAGVSVPPVGTMAASQFVSLQGEAVPVTMGFDGSNKRLIGETLPRSFYVEVAQIPGSQGIVFVTGTHDHKLYAAEDGKAVRLLLDDPRISSAGGPAVTPDRSWVYFAAAENDFSSTLRSLWRVRLNGDDLQKVPFTLPADVPHLSGDLFPAMSPDGTKLALHLEYRTLDPEIAILDLSTGALARTGIFGGGAKWSPDGQRIAYIQQRRIWTARPDGSDRRQVPTTHQYWSRSAGRPFGLDWSPDGAYVIAQRDQSFIDIVDVATGAAIPLPYTRAPHGVVGGNAVPIWLK